MTRIIHRLRSDQRGITMTEMLMGMFVFVIIFGAILTMVEGSMRNQDRITPARASPTSGPGPC